MPFICTQELIQNADDAGATEVTFILDHRDLPTLSPNLVDSRAQSLISNFQGPALLSYNDAVFLRVTGRVSRTCNREKLRILLKCGFGKDSISVYEHTPASMALNKTFTNVYQFCTCQRTLILTA